MLPITWLTATKALSDAPAAGLLALELLAADVYRERRALPALAWTALAGAAATGARPQNVLVTGLVLGLMLARSGGPSPRGWRGAVGFGVFVAGCLVWLAPTMVLQARWPEAGGSVWAYPTQLWHQWTWRLDQPKAFVGATGQTGEALLLRVWLHFGGLFTRGFAFTANAVLGTLGFALLVAGWFLCWRRRRPGSRPTPRQLAVGGGLRRDRVHLPAAGPALLPARVPVAAPARAGRVVGDRPLRPGPGPRRAAGRSRPPTARRGPSVPAWITAALPVVLLVLALPLAWRGHAQAAPPVRLVPVAPTPDTRTPPNAPASG